MQPNGGLPSGMPMGMGMPMMAPGMVAPVPAPPGATTAAGTVPGMVPGQMQAMLMYQQMMQQQMQHQALQQQATSTLTMQAAQAYEDSKQAVVDPEVQELADNFKLDDRITKDLDIQMKRRKESFEDDMKALYEILEGARNPAGLLRVKIREMEEGVFRGCSTPDKDVEELAKKFNLDAQAAAKLAEVLAKREDRKKDLRQLAKHLELSNKTSSLVMLMLKDLRAGLPVKDPEYPAAVGSYAHKRGLKRKGGRSRSRKRRRSSSDSSSSPPRGSNISRSSGAGPLPKAPDSSAGNRPMTLLERFG